jgi:ABC-type ATPase with predicted acetyltransferase domain
MKKWRCKVCGYIHEGDGPPDVCPICGVGPEEFVPYRRKRLQLAQTQTMEMYRLRLYS